MLRKLFYLGWAACGLMYPLQVWALSGGEILESAGAARSAGMGDMHTALSGDLDALHTNVAGLADLPLPSVSSLYTSDIFENQHASLAFGLPVAWLGADTLAISLLDFMGAQMDVNLDNGSSETLQSQNDVLFTVGYAHQIQPQMLVGVAVKYLRSTLVEEYTAQAFGGDIGVLVKEVGGLQGASMGVTIQNMGTEIKYDEQGDPMPTTLRVGLAHHLTLSEVHGLRLGADLLFPNDRDPRQNFGAEYAWRDMLFVRGGYKLGYNLDSFTAGAGVQYLGWSVDYAWSFMGFAGSVHRVGLEYQFAIK